MIKTCLSLGLALCAAAPAFADEAQVYDGEEGCKFVRIAPQGKAKLIGWKGPCKDGYADGKGVVEWEAVKGQTPRLDATMERGEISGEATLSLGADTYVGTFTSGLPDGQGYFKWGNGNQYEGGIKAGKFHGHGTIAYNNGDVFEGEFKDGLREGFGHTTFALGGSFEGTFEKGKEVGRVKIVHAGSGRVYEGDIKDYPCPGPVENEKFIVRQPDPVNGKRPKVTALNVPPRTSWDQLSPEQQNRIRNHYFTLAKGDEPPYPVDGPAEFYVAVQKAANAYRTEGGLLRLHVLVGADGNPKEVRQIGDYDKQVAGYVASVLMNQRYKPARCQGGPCEMSFPYYAQLVVQK
jgi:hypothetical protein